MYMETLLLINSELIFCPFEQDIDGIFLVRKKDRNKRKRENTNQFKEKDLDLCDCRVIKRTEK